MTTQYFNFQTIVGRPFLADNGIRLDHSQDQGEILSYKEPDGRRFCIPICSPEAKGWHIHPPKGMELCNSTQIEEWKINHISNIRRFQELPQENSRINNTKVSIKPNPEIPIKNSKAELTSNDLKMSKVNNVNLNYPQTSENTYSFNMEASITIEVELVQNEGLKPKQLVNSVSPVCEVEESTNLQDNGMNEEEEEQYSNMFSFSIFNNAEESFNTEISIMQNKDMHNENFCKVYKPEIIDLTLESPTTFLRETKTLPPPSIISIESEPEVTIMQELPSSNSLLIQSQQERFKMELLAHQQTLNQNMNQDSSALNYLIDPILFNYNNNQSSSSPHSLEEDLIDLTLISIEDKLISNKKNITQEFNVHEEDFQPLNHGNNHEKEFQLEDLIHQEYLLSPSELENYNFGSPSQIIKSLNLEDSEYFSQQNIVPQEDAVITLPDEILDKLQPLEENIPVTTLEIINNLQPKDYYQELTQEEEDLLEIYDGLINPNNRNKKEKTNNEMSLIEEENNGSSSINLLFINEEKKITKNKITKKFINELYKQNFNFNKKVDVELKLKFKHHKTPLYLKKLQFKIEKEIQHFFNNKFESSIIFNLKRKNSTKFPKKKKSIQN
ncbi:hypothetical protein O181_039739 [Austropuccinia psidii MF-1]|uniref:Uncharacterized protein n=1 Tax=Austropuccinia psidii MF-1 TaxID=1389203 RepID=A0A9Q3DB17_9BASI|nr:hypothetical protein [Austropuccinia psidii MF-1]